jgi:hypothetical protein
MRRLVSPALAILALTLSTFPALADVREAPAFFGSPWISIESPPNPYNPETKGALLVVRVYHHGEVAFFPVNGTAEGLVDGRRQTVKLEFTGTSTPGMYALKFTRPSSGNWILVISVGKDRSQQGSVSAVVTLGSDGTVASVQVPSRLEGQWLAPQVVTDADINSRLKEMAAA